MAKKIRSIISKLPPRMGGYYYVTIPATVVASFPKGKKERLQCTINNHLHLNCGLNHLGTGDFYIIVSTKNFKQLQVAVDSEVQLQLTIDANPLGVAIPDVLEALLEQDEELAKKFNALTDGKKRGIIFATLKSKNIDTQIKTATKFILNGMKMK